MIISLMGTFGEANVGDDLLLISTIYGLRAKWPDCFLVIFTGQPRLTRQLLFQENFPLKNVRLVYTGRHGWREPGLPFFKSLSWIPATIFWLKKSDLFLTGPGNQLQNLTRRGRLFFFLSRSLLALLWGTNYAFFGIGYWEVRGWLSRKLLRGLGNRSLFFSTRDLASARELTKLAISPQKIFALADLSFSEEPPIESSGRVEEPVPLVGWTARFLPNRIFSVYHQERFEDSLISFFIWLSEKYKARLLFFPFYQTSALSDLRLAERINSRLQKTNVSTEIATWKALGELKTKFANCDGFLATRFHAVLLAVQTKVPFLALSYAPKIFNFMAENDLENFVIPIEKISLELLKEKWELLWKQKETLKEKLTQVRRKQHSLARLHFELTAASLEGSTFPPQILQTEKITD